MKKCILIGCGLLAGCLPFGQDEGMIEKPDPRPLVKVSEPAERAFTESLKVQGTVRTRNSAAISARVPGTIDEILVEEGAEVAADTVLFRVDRVNLENGVAQAKAAAAAATAAVKESESAEAKAKWDAERMQRLYDGKAVTKDAWEKAKLQFDSATCRIDAAKAKLEQATAALRAAEKNLADSTVRAPFAGKVVRKLKDAGDFVGAGTPVFTMDDPSAYELCVSLPSEYYGKVRVGETKIGDRPVTYRAASVDPRTRTFEIRCELPKSEDLAPGMIQTTQVVFRAFRSEAVPEGAVGVRGGRTVVFAVREGKVVALPVAAGLVTDGWVAVAGTGLAGERIVTEGMLLLNEGEEVRSVLE